MDCGRTQILLPTELTVRRADTTEAIGNALVAKANGAGRTADLMSHFCRAEPFARHAHTGVAGIALAPSASDEPRPPHPCVNTCERCLTPTEE